MKAGFIDTHSVRFHLLFNTMIRIKIKMTVKLKNKYPEYLFWKEYIFSCEGKNVRGYCIYPKINGDGVTVCVSGLQN
jgi:hypothetical protein